MSVILSQKNVEFVTPYYKLHLIHADEDDNKFVDCAFSAGASCIVSNDAHFKTLNEIKFPRIFVVNIKDFVELLLRNQGNNQLHNLLLDTVEEGEVYRLCLTKEEGIIPKNKGDEGRKKFFVVVGKDQEGNAIGFVFINSEINKHLPESRRKLHNKPSLDCKILENQNFIQIYWYG